MVSTIAAAVTEYQNERGSLPAALSTQKGRDTDTDSSAPENLITTLMGINVPFSKRINYLGDINEAKEVADGRYESGIVRKNDIAALVDPWGHFYHIRLDTDGDGFVDDPSEPGRRLKRSVIVWSAGKDGDPDTWKDNITSWPPAQ